MAPSAIYNVCVLFQKMITFETDLYTLIARITCVKINVVVV